MDRQKSAEAVGAGITARQRAEPVVEARDGISARPEQMPRKRALKPEVADGIREVRLGAHRAAGDDVTKARNNRNRRIRNRSYGGVGGRGPRGPLLPDSTGALRGHEPARAPTNRRKSATSGARQPEAAPQRPMAWTAEAHRGRVPPSAPSQF